MKIHVVAFATASDILGRGATEVELPDGAKLSDLQALLFERHPKLDGLWPRLAVAVDGQLAKEDLALADGVEVALLPPVSGGLPAALEAPTARLRAELVHEAIDVPAVERAVADPACGAVLLFLGNVRNHHRGRRVARLTYSAYEDMARERLLTIVDELESDDADPAGIVRVAIVHRLGDVPIGEPSVAIAVASAHREAAYETSRLALERLKREVPIWKRETYDDGSSTWREEEPLG